MLGLALVWGAGMLLSFVSNRVHIAQVQTSLATLQQSSTGDEQLLALNELTRELGRLDYRAAHGTPWYQRFGLNQNPELLANALAAPTSRPTSACCATRPWPACNSSSAP